MPRKHRAEQEYQLPVSDEVAAYIANALMQLALDFENNHDAQIRRHHETITPKPDDDPRQLDLFRELSPS